MSYFQENTVERFIGSLGCAIECVFSQHLHSGDRNAVGYAIQFGTFLIDYNSHDTKLLHNSKNGGWKV